MAASAVAVAFVMAVAAAAASAALTYDRKAVVVNGQRRILISGSIHYPRSTPEARRTRFPFLLLLFTVLLRRRRLLARRRNAGLGPASRLVAWLAS
jgi:hypothetical protein